MATFKHISSKNANYGAAEQYLTFEHDEFTMKPTLDGNGRLVLRDDYRISSLARSERSMHNMEGLKFYKDRVCLNCNQTFTAGGYMKVSTGPLAKELEPAVVPVETAIAMAKEQGADSLKYFPMGGLKYREEFEAVVKACAENDFHLEPMGGIDLDNFKEILSIAVNAGVKKVIPHVYSSIIDKESMVQICRTHNLLQ